MDDREFYGIMSMFGLVALLAILHSKIIKQHEQRIVRLTGDVAFLMDRPPVSHETEER